MKIVLDSNVLISILNIDDANHPAAAELIARLNGGAHVIYAPVTYLWDMDAYLRHPDKSRTHRQSATADLKITTCDVTSGLYARTYSREMAFIKGADRIFVSLAKDQGAPLVTNDKQLLGNAAKLGVQAVSVNDLLNELARSP